MKKVFIIFLFFSIISCGKGSKTEDEQDGTFTLICDVENELRNVHSQIIGHSKESREYSFVKKELYPYQCNWGEKIISCWADQKVNYKKNEVLINIDRVKGEISGYEIKVNESSKEVFLVFNGTCKKLEKKF
jgi:hypothetical protein